MNIEDVHLVTRYGHEMQSIDKTTFKMQKIERIDSINVQQCASSMTPILNK